MYYSLVKNIKNISAVAVAATLFGLAPVANAGVIVAWNFDNAADQQYSNIAASTTTSIVKNAFFDSANNGAFTWSANNKVTATRWFNQTNNTPTLTFTLDQSLSNVWLSFNQFSNHNPNYPTSPQYNFALQTKVDNVWRDIKRDLVASAANFGQEITVNVGSTLAAGTHTIRWIGYNFKYGTDSNTEYFALDNVKLYTASEPAAMGLFGLVLAGWYSRRRHNRQQAAAVC